MYHIRYCASSWLPTRIIRRYRKILKIMDICFISAVPIRLFRGEYFFTRSLLMLQKLTCTLKKNIVEKHALFQNLI
jgi:hypothetical protein